MRVHTFRYDLLRSDAIQSQFVNFRFTISNGLISRSDEITYIPIGLLRSSLGLGLDLTRSSQPALVAQLDAPSDWRPGGRGFNPHRGRQHSFVEIDLKYFLRSFSPFC